MQKTQKTFSFLFTLLFDFFNFFQFSFFFHYFFYSFKISILLSFFFFPFSFQKHCKRKSYRCPDKYISNWIFERGQPGSKLGTASELKRHWNVLDTNKNFFLLSFFFFFSLLTYIKESKEEEEKERKLPYHKQKNWVTDCSIR